jgi:hypothetical protein
VKIDVTKYGDEQDRRTLQSLLSDSVGLTWRLYLNKFLTSTFFLAKEVGGALAQGQGIPASQRP